MRKILFNLVFITIIVLFVSICQASDKNLSESFPKRNTFTLPAQLKDFGKGLEQAGVKIIYGPNSVPAPEGISEAAKKVWLLLPQVPLQAQDLKKLDALRKFVNSIDDATFEKLKTPYSMKDRIINGKTTLWITPPQLKHNDKVLIFIHGGGWIVNTRKAQLNLQTAVASSLGMKVVSIEYGLSPEHPYPAPSMGRRHFGSHHRS